MSDPRTRPNTPRDRSLAARGAARSAKAERERRVVEGLTGRLSMAEIARREGIPSRGLRKYVRNLLARRAPEATGAFIATQMSRLNEALIVSFGAMSAENLPAVDRVVRIVRELDRYHGIASGARGTESRRKPLESLVSGAEMESSPRAEDEALADILPDPSALPPTIVHKGGERAARGTGTRRNLLESLDSGAATAADCAPLADADWMGEAARADADPVSEPAERHAGLAS